jgi:secondary thiamine-phosphate synthase enzyme
MLEKFSITTNERNQFIDITTRVKDMLSRSKIENGIVVVYCPHTTAGITINEGADPDVQRDIIGKLKKLIPHNENYYHTEGNSDSHIKCSLIGSAVTLILESSNLVLGTWQSIYFCEFDGPRTRHFYVKVING